MQATEQTIRSVVQEVLAQLGKSKPANGRSSGGVSGDWGVFPTV
ncbi:MAG: hypothetical protein U0903_15270 [Planctomycetales bacterium]